MFFCLEILGESACHKYLVQSGWSGRAYAFRYNRPTHSHIRAYRSMDEYLAERVDIHKAANVWPLLANLLPEDQVEPHVFMEPPGGLQGTPTLVGEEVPAKCRGRGSKSE